MSLSDARKAPRQERAQATVTAILDATAHIWAEEGYDAVNTNRVAEAAGVSIGSLYQYFPNKSALVGAVAVRHAEAMAETYRDAAASMAALPIRDLIATLIKATLEAHARSPRLRRAILEELPRLGRPARVAELKEETRLAIVSLLSRHRDKIGVADLNMAAFVVINCVEQLSHMAYAEPGSNAVPALEKHLKRLVTSYLLRTQE